jgi:hypothetical protein
MYHRSVIQKVFVETPLFLGVDQSKTAFKMVSKMSRLYK